jgi:hypothetical protein
LLDQPPWWLMVVDHICYPSSPSASSSSMMSAYVVLIYLIFSMLYCTIPV